MADFDALSPDNKDELGLIGDRWQVSSSLRRDYDRLWELCILKLAGRHWLTYDFTSRQFRDASPLRDGMEFRRTNLLRRDHRALKSIIKRAWPKPVAIPGPGAGSPEEKRIAVDIGNGLFENWFEMMDRPSAINRITS